MNQPARTTSETGKQRSQILAKRRLLPFRLPRLISRLINAGTLDYPESQRHGLVVANSLGYMASLSSLTYAINYAMHDVVNLWPVVAGNLLSAALTASVPFVHRFGPVAGALLLSSTIFATIFFFIAYIGRESGIQLNYIGAAAVALVILGTERVWWAVGITVAGVVLHLVAWYLFPSARAVVQEEWWFLDAMYFFSATSIMAIVFLVVLYAFRLVREAQDRSDALLLNVMPERIAGRLKQAPDQIIADGYDEATVLFADMVGFTPLSAKLGAAQMVSLLDELFSAFDALAARYGVEKIKTVGDAYMVVSGVPDPRPDHARAAALFGLDLFAAVAEFNRRTGNSLDLRVGIASGPLMAGVIGRSKFAYDVWGPTVNLAARLEAYGEPGEVHVSVTTADLLGAEFDLTALGERRIKGIGRQNVLHLKAQYETAPA